MPQRARLALMLLATFVLVGALAVVLFGPSASGGPDRAEGFRGSLRPEIPPQDFTLRDEEGRRVRLSDFRGAPVALTFLYTTCEDTCPTTAATIRSALDDAGTATPVLAVSVDPANDTAERARRFLVDRRLTGRMRFLLGSRSELEPVWDAYGIQHQTDRFDHSAYVLLVDSLGRQRVGFPFSQLTTDDLSHDLRLLEAEADRVRGEPTAGP